MTAVYSIREAAKLLGLHPQTVKHHIYKSGHFKGKGKLVGKTLVFTEDEIAEMKAILAKMPSPGRQPGLSRSKSGARERQDRALRMQEAGKTLTEIAQALGYSDTSSVSRAIAAAKKRKGK